MKDENGQCYPSEEHGKKMFLSMLLLVIIALGSFYVLGNQFAGQKGNIYVSSQSPDNGISVSGEAKTKIAPNQGKISFTVETNDNNSAKIAQDSNAESSAEVVAALKSTGLTDDDIRSTSFSVQPIYSSRYVCPDETTTCDSYDRMYKREIIGYRATHTYSIKFEDVKKAGTYIDKISTGDNAVSVDSISFTLKDETRSEIERQLLADAAKDARGKAEKMAAGFGATVGKVLSASESFNYPSYYGKNYLTESMIGAAMDTSAPETVIYPTSDIEVSASVSAMFEVN